MIANCQNLRLLYIKFLENYKMNKKEVEDFLSLFLN